MKVRFKKNNFFTIIIFINSILLSFERMGYQSQRDKIKETIEKYVVPFINEKDLEYDKVLSNLSEELSCSKGMVEDVLQTFISSGKIKEIRILTIPDQEVTSWLKEQKDKEEKLKKELKEFEQINVIKNGD